MTKQVKDQAHKHLREMRTRPSPESVLLREKNWLYSSARSCVCVCAFASLATYASLTCVTQQAHKPQVMERLLLPRSGLAKGHKQNTQPSKQAGGSLLKSLCRRCVLYCIS